MLLKYDITETISTGRKANVIYKAINKDTKDVVAIKMSKKPQADPEMEIFKKLSHPHIIKCIEMFSTESAVHFVLEYANGKDLFDFCVSGVGISEQLIKIYFRQILSAIKYLHESKYYHGDIKLENILMFKSDPDVFCTRILKLIDFEFSRKYRDDMALINNKGTLSYAAPEVLLRKPLVGPESDIWSLGVCLYVMIFSTFPIVYEKDEQVVRKKLEEFTSYGFKVSKTMSLELHQLLCGMLTVESKFRYTINDVHSSDWLNAMDISQ